MAVLDHTTDNATRLRRLRRLAKEIQAVDAKRDLFILERMAERGIAWSAWWANAKAPLGSSPQKRAIEDESARRPEWRRGLARLRGAATVSMVRATWYTPRRPSSSINDADLLLSLPFRFWASVVCAAVWFIICVVRVRTSAYAPYLLVECCRNR